MPNSGTVDAGISQCTIPLPEDSRQESSPYTIKIYEKNQEQIATDFFQVRNKFDDVTNMLINRDSFIDRIYPLRMYTMISDAIYSCIDRKSSRSLAEFEAKYLKELNELALITNKSLDEHDG